MRITIKSENEPSIDDQMLDYAEEKLGKVEKFFNNIQEADLVLSETRGKSVAEVTLLVSGKIIRAETQGATIRAAIDKLSDKIEAQMRKYKERLIDRSRKNARESNTLEKNIVGVIPPIPPTPSEIIREKKFPVEAMTDEDAIEQIELLGHDFFVYKRIQGDKDTLAVMYRRKDGGYGVLVPEILG